MKYINQINIALVAAAGLAVILAFGQTYFSSVPAPQAAPASIQGEAPIPSQTPGQDRDPGTIGSRSANPISSRAPETGAVRTPPTSVQQAPAQPTQGQSPLPDRSVSTPPRPTPRQLDSARPQPTVARPPAQPDARRRGPRFQPQPDEGDEGNAQQPPPNMPPRSPEARRDQNRRTNPTPPPARSSMPEQRPQF